MLQELGEHGDGVVLDDGVCLGVGPGHDVAQAPERRVLILLTNERRVLRLLTNERPVPEAGRHDLDLPAVQVPHQVGDHPGIHNILRSNNVNINISIIINNIS